MKTAFIHSDDIERYHYPPDCPFKTERAGKTKSILKSMGFYAGGERSEVAPVRATDEELLLFHTREYLDILKRTSAGTVTAGDLFAGLGTQDTPIFADLYDYAVLAAGGSITGANLLLKRTADIAFNPSGGYHHAFAGKAAGFCYINDVVLACMTLARAGKRVFCLDIDAHHGNGTQEAFYGSRDVFTVSLHESGETLFPWGGYENEIGTGAGRGYNVNLPFPALTDDDAYVRAFGMVVPPLAKAFNPDAVVLEIGMDILSVDPLTHLSMTNNALADILHIVLSWDKPLLAVGGGGYSPEDTARGWARAWSIICGLEVEEDQYMGLGGVFLGTSEWDAGLKDRHIYLHGEDKVRVNKAVDNSIELIRKAVFPLHGL